MNRDLRNNSFAPHGRVQPTGQTVVGVGQLVLAAVLAAVGGFLYRRSQRG